MRTLQIIARRDFREMVSTTAFRMVGIVAGVITVGLAIGGSIALRLQPWYGDPELFPVLNFILGLVLYFLSFLILLAFTWSFSAMQITKEKVNGNIECLMATPVRPKTLWMGKSIAVFIPGYLITVAALLIVLLVGNLAVALPGWGEVAFPWATLVLAVVVNPLLFAAVLAFIVLISLAGNPDIAITPSFVIGFGLMMGIPAGMATGVFDITSWPFVLWYLVGALLIVIIDLVLMRLLTRQKIVMSSKGS